MNNKINGWDKFCAWLIRRLGWTVDDTLPEEPKCIIIGAPHTTIWDFFIAYLYYRSIGGRARCMVKKELFLPGIAWIIRAMGGFPVDRTNGTAVIRSVISEMEKSESFHLAIAVEGTRKPVRKWKIGFHLIAKAIGCPVYMAYFDWGTKHIGHGKKVELTDDPRADMIRIQQMYEDMHLVGKHPKNYITK